MNKRREVSNVKFFGGLAVLAGMLISLAFPFRTNTEAKETAEIPAAVSEENKSTLKKTDDGKMPLLFEENKGQTDRDAKFISRGAGYTLYLAETEAVFSLKVVSREPGVESLPERPQTKDRRPETASDILRMKFAGAKASPKIEGEAEVATKTNYYTGRKRFENLANYARVNYKNLYDGIDAVFYGNADNQLEYDFVVAPETDTNKIGLNFDGAENISIDDAGNLVIKTANAVLVQPKPLAYQELDGQKREVEVHFVINPESEVGFALGEYDKSKKLVIDPVLSYLTYVGGGALDEVHAVDVDSAGNAYISGTTLSTDFPTPGSNVAEDKSAVFVAKISADGGALLYVTLLDGGNDDGFSEFNLGQTGTDVAVDAAGNAFVTGLTYSRSFPTTDNAYQKVMSIGGSFTNANAEAFVTKLDASGQISYSTFLGGRHDDYGNSIAVDSSGKAYVAGATYSGLTFPTKNQFQGTGVYEGEYDAFLTVFTPDGSDIVYSTGLGGNDNDFAFAVALDSANNAYITGMTLSENRFPTKNAFQAASGGGRDAFVAKFNTNLSGDDSLIYSTYVGGSGTEEANAIVVSPSGKAHITGVTGSFNFPLLNAIDTTNQVNEAFVTVLNSNGSLANSTFLGGSGREFGGGIDLDAAGNIYVTGSTDSTDFPMALPFQSTNQAAEAFVTKLRFDGASGITRGIMFSSYLGGSANEEGTDIAVLNSRVAFVAGSTSSTDLATTPGVLKGATNNADGFVARILDTHLDSVGTFRPSSTFQITQSTTNVVVQTTDFGLSGQKGVAGDWNGDGVDTIGHFTSGVWKYRNVNFTSTTAPAATVNFGQTGDLPVIGDWNGDGIDTPGVYRPSVGKFFLTNSNAVNPPIEITVNFGIAEDLPVAGDWNGDGVDSVGVFRPSAGQFFLTDDNVIKASIDQVVVFGTTGDQPTAGDWDGNGVDTIAVFRPSTKEFFLTNDHLSISDVFLYNTIGKDPIAGDWDGLPLP
jgi:hypothetical protein